MDVPSFQVVCAIDASLVYSSIALLLYGKRSECSDPAQCVSPQMYFSLGKDFDYHNYLD